MQPRQLGHSKIMVTPIGLGCWQFAGGKSIAGSLWKYLDQETINQIVKISLENGVNWFDTAEAYGFGQSELALAAGLQAAGVKPENAVIATKWMPYGRFASSIVNNIDSRLKKLNPYPIRLLQIHNPNSFSSIEKQMKALADLLRAGKILAGGVSNFDLKQMRQAHAALKEEGFDLASNQMHFNLLDRSIEKNGVLDFAKEKGITIIAYSPLEKGILTGRFHEHPELTKSLPGFRKFMPALKPENIRKSQPLMDELKSIGEKYMVTPAQVALNWLINFHGEVVVAIPGASSPQQAQQNAAVMKFTLSKAELARLDQVSWQVINH